MKILSSEAYKALLNQIATLDKDCAYLRERYNSADARAYMQAQEAQCSVLKSTPSSSLSIENEMLKARCRQLENDMTVLQLKIGLKGFSVCEVPAQPATIMLRKVADAA